MKSIERTIKTGLAALLVLMMLALGGLAVTNTGAQGGLSAILSGTGATSQKVSATGGALVQSVTTQTTPAATTGAQSATTQQSGVFDARAIARQGGPAVVTVVNTLQQSTGSQGQFGGRGYGNPLQTQPSQAEGSGVIISSDGYIVTNQHVVDSQQSLEVIFADGTKAPATLVGQDTYTDLAVIKVNVKVPAVATLGDSSTVEAGQPVVAIGSALGDYANTVTEGIVSGLHRSITDGGATVSTSLRDLIQTDAAINHGNSGGPLFDLSGNVIGINTAVVRSSGSSGDVAEGLGFAIPSNTVKAVTDQLIKNGTIAHPYLGITYQTITSDIAQQNNLPVQEGLFVSDVASGSPAEQAGIQANSVIIKFDGTTLTGGTDLATLLNKYKVGDSVKLTVIAPGATTAKDVTIVLGSRPSGQ